MEEESKSPQGDWSGPLTMAAAGLVLMVGGYLLLDYAPPPPDPALADLKERAKQDPGLEERLQQIGRGSPPYRRLGTVAIYAGLLLFVAAGVRMYRHKPAPPTDEPPSEEQPT
jgi:hypothetical protein